MIDKQTLISLIRQLPTIPQAVLELQKLLVQPNVTVEQVEPGHTDRPGTRRQYPTTGQQCRIRTVA